MRIGVVLVSSVTLLVFCTAQVAEAAPTPDCRNLAKQFGGKPEELSDSDLARLRTCVSNELSSRFERHRPPPPAPAAAAAESPAPTSRAAPVAAPANERR